MALVWTEWVDTAAIAPLDSQGKGVRETLMNVSQTPAVLPTVLIASSCPMTTSASANQASQVRHRPPGSSVCIL